MADNQSQLDIIIQAQDNASKSLLEIHNALNKVGEELGNTSKQTAGATEAVGSMAKGFVIAELAVRALEVSFVKLEGVFTDSIKTATDYQRSLQGVQAVGAELGQSTDQVTAAVKRLTQDGLLNTKQAADALRNVMQRGFNVDQATQAVQAMKDFGSFGKKSQEDLGQAIDSATLGWRHQRSVMMENAGFLKTFQEIWKEYAAAQGRSASSLSEAEKRQAELNAVLKQGSIASGDAAAYAASAAGQQEIFANKTLDAKAALGDALLPAFQLVEKGLLNALIPATKDGQRNMVGLQQTFASLAFGVSEAANVVIGFARVAVGALNSIVSGTMQPLDDAWSATVDSMKNSWSDYTGSMDKIAKGGFDNVKASQDDLDKQLTDEHARALRKMQEQIADANKAFAEANNNRKHSFEESLQQMVQAHQDKVTTIKNQLASEQASYDDALKSRKDNYDEQVASLEDAHKQKVEDITQQITDERAKGIYVDGLLYSQGNEKKIEKLQDSLEKEDAAYVKRANKLKDKYDDEVKSAQTAFDKKQTALQASLAKEQAILQAHAAEVAQFSQRVDEDDISRIQRKYAQETQLAQQHLDDQLARIRRSAEDQGVAIGNGIAKGVASSREPVKQAMANLGKDASAALNQGFASGGLVKGGGSSAPAHSLWGDLGNWYNHLGDIEKRASGGPVNSGQPYMVGERGPEMFVPSQAGSIAPNGSMGGVTITNFHSYSQADLTAFSRELAWRLS